MTEAPGTHNPNFLPPDIPVPQDDGRAEHLTRPKTSRCDAGRDLGAAGRSLEASGPHRAQRLTGSTEVTHLQRCIR
jgi:hypothetical protein